MSSKENTPGKPGTSKEDRLKQALKANMARRKAQARARKLGDTAPADAQTPDSHKKGQA